MAMDQFLGMNFEKHCEGTESMRADENLANLNFDDFTFSQILANENPPSRQPDSPLN